MRADLQFGELLGHHINGIHNFLTANHTWLKLFILLNQFGSIFFDRFTLLVRFTLFVRFILLITNNYHASLGTTRGCSIGRPHRRARSS